YKYDAWQSWLRWWDPASSRDLGSFAGEKNESLQCCFSPDGHTLAAVGSRGEKSKVFLFRLPDRQLVKTALLAEKGKGEWLHATAPIFSPDGKWLTVITQVGPNKPAGAQLEVQDVPQPHIHLIDVAAGDIRETLIAPQGFARSARFSPDAR